MLLSERSTVSTFCCWFFVFHYACSCMYVCNSKILDLQVPTRHCFQSLGPSLKILVRIELIIEIEITIKNTFLRS